jgi:hypothetical protein
MKKIKYLAVVSLLLIGAIKLSIGQSRTIPSAVKPAFINGSEIKGEYSSYLKRAVSLEKYLPKNFVRNGSVDYTIFLQKGISENETVVFPDFPVLISDQGLNLKSNSVVLFSTNSQIILRPSNKDTYNMLNIEGIDNVKVYYPKLKGDLLSHKGKTGEWGMGIGIRSSQNIEIYNAQIEECWGDGIYVGFIWDKKIISFIQNQKILS